MDPLRGALQHALGAAYRIERELGGGGMSRVFLATDVHLEREVVVKVLSPDLAAGLNADRFAREIKLAAQLQAPHIVPVLTDGITADGLPYFTMPYVRGASLRQRMNDGALPTGDAVRIMRDIAQALAYAHGRGVVHRDIKPENVLLHEGSAVVADFGIAKALSAARTAPGGTLTQVGTSLGTPAYMSPEQGAGDDVDHRADLYALGVIAYEMLAGRHPFAGKSSAQQFIAAHIAEVPVPLASVADVPASIADVVMRCLAKNPDDRPQQATDVLHALDARTSSTPAPRHGPSRRTRRWATAGVAAVVVAVLVTLRALGVGPGASLLASGKLARSAQVLIADFNVPSADSLLGRVVSEAVRTTLGQSKAVRLVSTSTVTAALDRMRKPADTRLSLDIAREIAQREGAAALVTGDIATLGGAYVLTVRMIDARTGDLLATAQETADKANDLIPAIDRATRSLRSRIGESLKTLREATPLEKATTGSLEALREYTAALDANFEGDFVASAAHAERAIALDSNFARAYSSLSNVLGNMGAQVRRQDTLRARAFALRDRLPDFERVRVSEAYYQQGRGYDRAKFVAAAESLTVLNPTIPVTWVFLGNALALRGEFAAAESAYRRSIAIEPSRPLPYANLVSNLMLMGRWAAADSVMAAAPAGTMQFRSVQLGQVHRAYLHGHLDSASTLASEMGKSKRVELAASGWKVLRALALVQGRVVGSRHADAELHAVEARRGNPQPALVDSLSGAGEDMWQYSDPSRAIRRVAAALRVQPIERIALDERPYLNIAELYALAGDAGQAQRWVARYDADVTDPDRLRQQGPRRAHALSLLAVLEQRWGDALAQADIASRDPDGGPMEFPARGHFWRGFILAAAARPDEAIASYERFLAAPDLTRLTEVDADFLPYALERLGKLYEGQGNAARAIEHYSRVVSLWKGADAELQPRVVEVRKRIARLRRRAG